MVLRGVLALVAGALIVDAACSMAHAHTRVRHAISPGHRGGATTTYVVLPPLNCG